MKLSEALAALSSNKVAITIMDENDNALITFDAAGYESIKDEISERNVKDILITAVNKVSISLKPDDP